VTVCVYTYMCVCIYTYICIYNSSPPVTVLPQTSDCQEKQVKAEDANTTSHSIFPLGPVSFFTQIQKDGQQLSTFIS